jgi:hypothetical protein
MILKMSKSDRQKKKMRRPRNRRARVLYELSMWMLKSPRILSAFRREKKKANQVLKVLIE